MWYFIISMHMKSIISIHLLKNPYHQVKFNTDSVRFKHILFMTEHVNGLGRAKSSLRKLCLLATG